MISRWFNGQSRRRVARLNADGSLDASFGDSAVNNTVRAIVLQGNQILIGGQFTAAGPQPRSALARLNTDGTLDAGFVNPPISNSPRISAIALQGDKILIGGSFFIAFNHSDFARLNSNGSLDNTFQGRTNDDVEAIKIQEGKILVSGEFTTVRSGGVSESRNKIARFSADGTVDPTFRNVTEIGSSGTFISDFVVLPDGRIIIGGRFPYQINNISRSGLARLDSNGNLDATYDPALGSSTDVNSLALQSADGKLLVGGGFSTLRGLTRHNFVRLNPDASVDLFPRDVSLDNIGGGPPFGLPVVQALAIQPNDGKILVGGVFRSAGGRTYRGVVRLNPDSSVDTSFSDPGIFESAEGGEPLVNAIVVQPSDNKILVGGSFATVNGQPRRFLVRLNPNGSRDTSFNPNMAMFDRSVDAIALAGDKIMVGGFFGVFRLNSDGSHDPSFDSRANSVRTRSITVLGDGKILAEGRGDFPIPIGLKRFNTNGSVDPTFTATALSEIFDVALQNDKIVVVGTLFSNGQNPPYIARLNSNGSLDASFVDPNLNGLPNTVSLQADGRIIIGGNFTLVAGQPRNYLARLNVDGTLDTSYNPNAESTVYDTRIQSDGRLVVGGRFKMIGGVTVDFVARLLSGNEVNCAYSVNPPARTLTSAAGLDNFAVTTGAGCTWTAASNAPWLTVTSGTPGSGNGTVNYTVAANTTATPRTGVITIAGQDQNATHTVTQSGMVGPTPTPTPSTPTPTPTPVPGGDLIRDGGFEATTATGTNPNWTSTSTAFGSSLCIPALCGAGTMPRTGNGKVWFDGANNGTSAENGSVQQIVTIPSGGTAVLSYYLRIAIVSAPSNSVLTVTVDGTVVQTITEPATAESAYTLRTVNIASFATGAPTFASSEAPKASGTEQTAQTACSTRSHSERMATFQRRARFSNEGGRSAERSADTPVRGRRSSCERFVAGKAREPPSRLADRSVRSPNIKK